MYFHKYVADLGPFSSLPLWTEELIAGLDGKFIPLAAFAVITARLSCLSTNCTAVASASTTALGALQITNRVTGTPNWCIDLGRRKALIVTLCHNLTSDQGEYSQPPGLQSPWQLSLSSGLCWPLQKRPSIF